MHRSIGLAVSVVALSVASVLAQEQAPANSMTPAVEQPAGQPPATDQPVEATVVEPGGQQTGGGTLAQAATRLQELAQQLQQATADNVEQVRQEATSGLDEFEQAVQGAQGSGSMPQEQIDQMQQQIDQTRDQLATDPQQAAQTLQQLAQSAQQLEMNQMQADIPAEADRIIGKQLVTSGGEEGGEVTDVLVTTEGRVEAVLVERGGALGLGGTQVSITWDQIQIQGDQLSVNLTNEQMDALPEYSAD